MKIKTITCHNVYNYGASLQAFALQTFLEQCGHDVEIVDYRPDYLNFYYKLSLFVPPQSPVKKYTDRFIFLRVLYSLKRFVWSISSIRRKISFDCFTKNYLKLTREYNSFQELMINGVDADTFIVGSDQVWNSTTMLNGKDPAFYLQFVKNNSRKIAYAASFGSTSIDSSNKTEICKWLKSLDALSVREDSGLSILQDLGLEGAHVCDPVFLLSEEEWKQYIKLSEPIEPYVLIYNLTSINEKLISDARYAAEKLNVKLYSISPFKITAADKNFLNSGPDTFVSLIFNAEYVFTNSFHATAFSVISHRQFCTYNYHSTSNSSRMFSLLNEVDLLDRLNIDSIEDTMEIPIDYERRLYAIKECCENGKKWLINNI